MLGMGGYLRDGSLLLAAGHLLPAGGLGRDRRILRGRGHAAAAR